MRPRLLTFVSFFVGQGRTDFPYSTPNSEWPVLAEFESGQVIEINAVVVYYHWVSARADARISSINDLLRTQQNREKIN